MRKNIFILLFLLFAGIFAAFAAKAEESVLSTPKSILNLGEFNWNACLNERQQWDVHLNDQEFLKKADWYKLAKIDCTRHVSSAYMALYKNQNYGGPEKELGKDYLRLAALSLGKEHNTQLLKIFEQAKISNKKFLELFHHEIEWAEQETKKSAEELMVQAENVPLMIKSLYLHDNFQFVYYWLAYEHRHPDAYKKIEDLIKAREKSK